MLSPITDEEKEKENKEKEKQSSKHFENEE
jgi:hypothetical protein